MLLLHLSDLHFRKHESGSALDPNTHLRNTLVSDAETMCKQIGKSPDAILITGDLTYQADPEEFAFALSWLEHLASKCGTNISNVFMVPGNHDINRKIADKPVINSLHKKIKDSDDTFLNAEISALLKDQDGSKMLYESLSEYNLFAVQFFCELSAPSNTLAKRNLKLNDGSTLRLNGGNSTFVSGTGDKEKDLFVDESCFQISPETGVEHVFLCHHPYSWIRQGDRLRDHLNNVAKIQLFGHEHINRIDLKRDSIIISASAAIPSRHEQGWEPGYNLIELEVVKEKEERKLKVIAHVRIWQNNPHQFRPKMDKSKDYFEHFLKLEPWTSEEDNATVELAPSDLISSEPKLEVIFDSKHTRSEPMDSLRNLSIRFYKLTFSQKSEIAGRLGLAEEEDINQPDFERFRRVMTRAQQREIIPDFEKEVSAAESKK